MSFSTISPPNLNTHRSKYQKEENLIQGKEIKCVYYLMNPNRDPQNKISFFRKICQIANGEDEKLPLSPNNKMRHKDKLRIELNNYSLPFPKNFNYHYNFDGRYKALNLDKEPYNYIVPNFTNNTTNYYNITSNQLTVNKKIIDDLIYNNPGKSDLFPTALDLVKTKKETENSNNPMYKNYETSSNRYDKLPNDTKNNFHSMLTPKTANIDTLTNMENVSVTNSRNVNHSEKKIGVENLTGNIRSNSCFRPNNYVIKLKRNYFNKPVITHEKHEFLKNKLLNKEESTDFRTNDSILKQKCNEYNLSRMFELRKKELYVTKNEFLKFKNKLQKNMKF